MSLFKLVLAGTLFVVLASAAAAADRGTRADAVLLVQRINDKFKTDGAIATFQTVTAGEAGEFHHLDLTAFIYDLNGVNLAHGERPVLVGKNLISLKDQDGKFLIREMIDIARGPGGGWINYKWPDPHTSRVEDKSTYIERMGDDYLVGVAVQKH